MAKVKKSKPKLPPYVILKRGQWHVRITFPTVQRDLKGRIVYEQMSRKCEPETLERASEIAAFLKQQHKDQRIGTNRVLSVNDFLSQFLDAKRQNVSRNTYEFYLYLYEHHIKKTGFAAVLVPDVSTMKVQSLYSALAQHNVSAAWIKKIHTFVSMAFKQAVFWGLITKNPANGVIVPKPKHQESQAFTQDEARAFIKACRTDDKYIVFELALETGLRPQECLALRWSDVDLENRKLSVKQAVVEGYDHTGIEIGDTKTAASKRTIGFSDQLKKRLIRQRERLDLFIFSAKVDASGSALLRHKRAKGVNYKRRSTHRRISKEILADLKKYDLIFPASNGKPRSRQNVNRRDFKDVLKLAGIDPKRYAFKSLRHSCATLLAEKLHPKKLQKHMGHASLQTTLAFYVHVNDESQFEASEKIEAFLY